MLHLDIRAFLVIWTSGPHPDVMQAAGGAPCWDAFELSVCLPCLPPAVPLASEEALVRLWGDLSNLKGKVLGNLVFTDGSGFASSCDLVCSMAVGFSNYCCAV